MNISSQIRNRLVVKGFLINSLPKSGTHLLSKAVKLFLGNHSNRLHISRYTIDQFDSSDMNENESIPIGIDFPTLASYQEIQKHLLKISKSRGIYATAHIPFSTNISKLVYSYKIRSLLILRDPRDVVVSHARYIRGKKDHFLHEFYSKFSEEECIRKSIIGIEKNNDNRNMLLGIAERIHSIRPWMSEPFNHTIYFENLVGARGGGSDKAQLQELKNIAHHLGLYYRSEDLSYVAKHLFGGTVTFRKGSIGNWHNSFTEDHKKIFKDCCGQILIDLGYENDFNW